MNKKRYQVIFSALIALLSLNVHGDICEQEDRRQLSGYSAIGKLSSFAEENGCSATMISRSCALSAGHCHETFDQIDFNNFNDHYDLRKDQYLVDRPQTQYIYEGIGLDWAVLKIEKNQYTGLYPGEVQGMSLIGLLRPLEGDLIRVSGYGRSDIELLNFSQATSTGQISLIHQAPLEWHYINRSITRHLIYHRADMTPGSSGAALINETTQRIVGINSHGGCPNADRHHSNLATLINQNAPLERAINTCLQKEYEQDQFFIQGISLKSLKDFAQKIELEIDINPHVETSKIKNTKIKVLADFLNRPMILSLNAHDKSIKLAFNDYDPLMILENQGVHGKVKLFDSDDLFLDQLEFKANFPKKSKALAMYFHQLATNPQALRGDQNHPERMNQVINIISHITQQNINTTNWRNRHQVKNSIIGHLQQFATQVHSSEG